MPFPTGANNVLSKLNEDSVRLIRGLRQIHNLPYETIGKAFGITKPTTMSIVTGKTWRHVEQWHEDYLIKMIDEFMSGDAFEEEPPPLFQYITPKEAIKKYKAGVSYVRQSNRDRLKLTPKASLVWHKSTKGINGYRFHNVVKC